MSSATGLRVERSIVVNATKATAFARFIDMSAWWPLATHTIGPAPARASFVEPHAGGRWYGIDANGDEYGIGRVVSIDPPDCIVLTWTVHCNFDFDPSVHSTIEVRFFEEAPGRTRVELEHRDLEAYGEHADEQRAHYDGPDAWTYVVGRFAASFGFATE